MKIRGWHYYNHAAIPTSAPNHIPDISPIKNNSIWKISGGFPILASWSTDFDCSVETNWWYIIKDKPFNICDLKSKRRYEINKGRKNFLVREINPLDYKQTLYEIQKSAYSVYPKKYRPKNDRETFFKEVDKWNKFVVFGAFFRETDTLVGYALVDEQSPSYVDFCALKVMPHYEKHSANAALVDGILCKYHDFLSNGGFICDGSRNINHETHFQEYLEKYFGFRKAYCKLQMVYNPKIKWVIYLLFRFKKLFLKFDGIKIIHKLNAVLQMEEIRRDGEIHEASIFL